MEATKDLYNSKECYGRWLEKTSKEGVKDILKTNEKLLLKFLNDMFLGLNVGRGSKKGSRSFIRLNALRVRLIFIFKQLQERGIKDIRKTKPEDLHKLFSDMRAGILKTKRGEVYKSTADYVKIFKAFWHWNQKISKERIEDITEDLDTTREKAKFVYFIEKDFEKILEKASYDLKPILALALDSGMRVTELMNIKISDFLNEFKELNIRGETSKTFGRKIKLMMCSEQIKEYVKRVGLQSNDFFSQKSPVMINKELREIGKKFLTPEQIKYKNLTLYDFRHSSACFWLPRYKSESALKYRFGWKKSDMIHYYTEYLGMTDTINQEDMYLDITKTTLEKEIDALKKIVEFDNKLIKHSNQCLKVFESQLNEFQEQLKIVKRVK